MKSYLKTDVHGIER